MITFIYHNTNPDIAKEKVLTNLFSLCSMRIPLPNKIEIEFKNLNMSIYGETLLDRRFKNRIRLNANLSAKELFKPFIHELIHLNQTHTGKLGVYRNGTVMWEGKPYIVNKPINELTFKEHADLPWEQEVRYTEKKLLREILKDY